MLLDLLNSQNYIMVNIDSINILGLDASVYCAELLNVYKKALLKNKILENNYFKVDRTFITKRTSLSTTDQMIYDKRLKDVGIILISDDPNIISFDVEKYASVLSSENVRLLKDVEAQVNVKNKKADKEYIMTNTLKSKIHCSDFDTLKLLEKWIDTIKDCKGMLTNTQVELFVDGLNTYCAGDYSKMQSIIQVSIANAYRDVQWAINMYEKSVLNNKNTDNRPRNTTQRRSIRTRDAEVY